MKTSTKELILFTEREIEVLNLIVREYSTKEIASKLFLSPETIKTHRASIIHKLNVKNVAGVVREALYRDLVQGYSYRA